MAARESASVGVRVAAPKWRGDAIVDVTAPSARVPGVRSWAFVRVAMDAATIGLGIVVAEIGAASAGVPPTPLAASVAFGALVVALLAFRGMYRPRLSLVLLDDARGVLAASALAAMAVLSRAHSSKAARRWRSRECDCGPSSPWDWSAGAQ